MTNSIGICIGATSVTVAIREKQELHFQRLKHNGNPAHTVREATDRYLPATVGITGRRFRALFSLPTIPEPEAVELAYAAVAHRYPPIDCVLSFGGETVIAYALDAAGKIRGVHTGNRCAAGTGEFFLQQVRRIGLSVEEAIEMGGSADPYSVAGRCSVFCKSDCTHALNKGVPKGAIAAGLARMMTGKILELLKKFRPEGVLLIGGGSLNMLVLQFLRETYPQTIVPHEAVGFEAYGALLWGERQETVFPEAFPHTLVQSSFPRLPPLSSGTALVEFPDSVRGEWVQGEYLLGLDVGSTTTKAVLVNNGNRIVASAYLQTNGDPVAAARACYADVAAKIPAGFTPEITGLGVTGSGRHIAGVHAETPAVVNEIIAHATAAAHFDGVVDTIFEIGGQDAKYTSLTGGMATEYAMNEACSAGTGSFLEEACSESFNLPREEIAAFALQASNPPDFSDQCAAFIASDIKTAMQEGMPQEDILAGLVFSVCRNYLNRVKGSRPVGKKIFMQGGVCYNRAIPVAMAILCGRTIVVPPDPGLMGAFGAALEVRRRRDAGLLEGGRFLLTELAARDISYDTPFTCTGGKDECDRKCTISRIVVAGSIYPFGGACDRFYSLRLHKVTETAADLVRMRELRLAPLPEPSSAMPRVGLLPSLFTSTYLPLYQEFFKLLGFQTVRPAAPDPEGMERAASSFCRPLLNSHGYLQGLLQEQPDFLFLPQVARVDVEGGNLNWTCPFVQVEENILRAAFPDLEGSRVIKARLDFTNSRLLEREFISIAQQAGAGKGRGRQAFREAWTKYLKIVEELRCAAAKAVAGLGEQDIGIVIFGRPYNAFNGEANLGIPQKFASRGYPVLPHDLVQLEAGRTHLLSAMYWASGQSILRAAQYVANHPSLFGVYITSFSCGPDSFLTGYFRTIMGKKPSLVLELDDHAADAGIDTRVEAFLEIIKGYRMAGPSTPAASPGEIARVTGAGETLGIRTPDGRIHPFSRPGVRLLMPSMGETGTGLLAAALRHTGLPAVAARPPGNTELSMGKEEVGGKECLPLILTTGTLLRYLKEEKQKGEILAYFMPWAEGPCRFGQYRVFLEEYLSRAGIDDVALFSLNGDDGYAGLPSSFSRRAYLAVLVADGLEDIGAALLALAKDRKGAFEIYRECSQLIETAIARHPTGEVLAVTNDAMARLAEIPLRLQPAEATQVLLAGEIYARREGLTRRHLVERLAASGIVVRTAPVTEWIRYCDICVLRGLSARTSLTDKLRVLLKRPVMHRYEGLVAAALHRSGLVHAVPADMKTLLDRTARLLDPRMTGEAVLTVGNALMEIGDQVHGVISIGPFGCMPCRIAESLLATRMAEEKEHFTHNRKFWKENRGRFSLPFLAVETDGSPFSQVTEARLEVFTLAAHRLKSELQRIPGK